MANFVVGTGISPTEYKNLTVEERTAIVLEHNRQARRG